MATTIGILALQGAFAEHAAMVRQEGAQAVEVRKPAQLAGLDGLILPGGESTTMGLIAERQGMVAPLRAWVQAGRPTWGTCAGMILLADRVTDQKAGGQPLIGGLDVTVNRNYFGRQSASFEALIAAPILGAAAFRAIFIRAPAIVALGATVTALASVPGRGENVVVAVRQANLLATAFHPELTSDSRWHRLFLQIATGKEVHCIVQ